MVHQGIVYTLIVYRCYIADYDYFTQWKSMYVDVYILEGRTYWTLEHLFVVYFPKGSL